MTVSLISKSQITSSFISAWDELSTSSSEPNIFYESWFLLPALRHLDTENAVKLLTIRDTSDQKLIGIFPVVEYSKYSPFTLKGLSTWRHLHCFLCTPLVRNDFEELFFENLFSWDDSAGTNSDFLLFEYISSDGPIHRAAEKIASSKRKSIDTIDEFSRPLLRSGLSPSEYFKLYLGGRRIKDYRRKRSQFDSLGSTQFSRLESHGEIGRWAEDFLNLEASGWKGKQSTALLQNPAQRDFFVDSITDIFRRGRLRMEKLSLDGVPIAMRCAMTSPDMHTAFVFKIAFDERYERYSPGALLEIASMDDVLSGKEIFYTDSCAAPDQKLLTRLWEDKKNLVSILVSGSSSKARTLVGSAAILRTTKRKIAKTIFRKTAS